MKRYFLLILLTLICSTIFGTTLTVQNVSGTCGQTNVPVEIYIDDATGLAAFEFNLYFDGSKLQSVSAQTTSLTSGFSIAYTNHTDYIRVAAATGFSLSSGSGAICKIFFNVTSTIDGSSNLDLQNSLVNDVPPTEVDGTFTITGCCDVPSGMSNNSSSDIDPCSDTGVVINWSDPSNWGDGGNGTRYFQVLRNGTDISGNLSSSTHSYTDTTGTNGTSYNYQVKAINGCGKSYTTSGAYAADNVQTQPSCSSSPNPPDGATDVSTTPTLSWDAVSDATSYDIYFGTSSNPPYITNKTSTAYSPGSLNPQTKYYWKIVPKNSCGSASSCPIWSFTTGGTTTINCEANANPSSGAAPLAVNFTSSASGGMEPYTFFWEFGDGFTSNSQNTTHTYTNEGNYNWKLTVSDSANNNCYKNGTISVTEEPPAYSDYYIVPASAHSPGAFGSYWKTGLSICNFSSSSQNINLALLKAGQDNSNPQNKNYTIQKDSCIGFDDILYNEFNYEGAGALKISANADKLKISSRTYNDDPSGTYGQFIQGFHQSNLLSKGEVGYLIYLHKINNFRTNIGFSSLSSNSILITLKLYNSNGVKLAEKNINLLPYGYEQENDIFGQFGINDISYGYAIVSSTSDGALYIAYASVVDNNSNDPIFIPVEK